MTESTNTESASKAPTFIVYQARKGSNGKNYYSRMGVIFKHSEGEGVSIFIDAVPLDGKLVGFPPSAKKEA